MSKYIGTDEYLDVFCEVSKMTFQRMFGQNKVVHPEDLAATMTFVAEVYSDTVSALGAEGMLSRPTHEE